MAGELVVLEESPATTGDSIAFLDAFERELDIRFAASDRSSIIEARDDGDHAEFSELISAKRDSCRSAEIQCVAIPAFATYDRPFSENSVVGGRVQVSRLTFKSSHAEPVSPMMREDVVVSDHIVRWNAGT